MTNLAEEMKPLFVKGVRRSIVDHPDEIATIMNYLRKMGDLRANAKKVELLWMWFSKKSGETFQAVTDSTLENFATWLDSGMDKNDYFSVLQMYEDWEKSPNKSKEILASAKS